MNPPTDHPTEFNRRPNASIGRIYCGAFGCKWTPNRLRAAYDLIVSTFSDARNLPDKLVFQSSKNLKNRKWGPFKREHTLIIKTGFTNVQSFSLSTMARTSDKHQTHYTLAPDIDWITYAAVRVPIQSISLNWIPSFAAITPERMFELFRNLVDIGQASYGSVQERSLDDGQAISKLGGAPDHVEYGRRTQGWIGTNCTRVNSLLLLDVFPRNFLSQPHLDAPFGKSGRSLADWIIEDPSARGRIIPHSNRLKEWILPQHHIPEICEQLFKAGRLYYYRFFNELDYDRVVVNGHTVPRDDYLQLKRREAPIFPPEKYFRPRIHDAWEADDPIPKIFQADFLRSLQFQLRSNI